MAKFSRRPAPAFDRGAALLEAFHALRRPIAPRRRPVRPRSPRKWHVRTRRPIRMAVVAPAQDPRLAVDAVLNHEGGLAFSRDVRTTLANMAACCLVNERAFYGDTTGKVRVLIHRAANTFPEWTVKLAVFLREQLHLRSISQLVLAHAAMVDAARPFVAKGFERVAIRPDDMIEIAALLKDSTHGLANALPAVIRRAIGTKLNRLSEFHAIKYRKARQFGLKHVVRLCHPRPASPRQSTLFRYILDRTTWLPMSQQERDALPMVDAFEALRRGDACDAALLDRCIEARLPWEMVVPHFGSTRKVWSKVAFTLPIMALVRNLRNLHEVGSLKDRAVRGHVRTQLTDPEIIRRSRQLPFRWLAAYRVMEGLDPEVARWLETAMELSVANLPRLPGVTAIACDNSGSMHSPISSRSEIQAIDIGSVLGAVADTMCEQNLLFTFGTTINLLQFHRPGRILSRARQIATDYVGYATHAYKVLKVLLHLRIPVDRILFFTDMQIYGAGSCWSADEDFTCLLGRYRQEVAPNARTYIFNLQPDEHFMTPADQHGVTTFSGWNADLLSYVATDSDGDGSGMVDRIGQIEL